MNKLNEFNTGGSHKSNPYGGIPMGINPENQEQTVQEGETMFDIEGQSFIFSTNYTLNSQDISNHNLPKNLKGLNMADATKKINKSFDDREDAVSNKTKSEFLKRIAEAQEVKKEEELALQETMQTNNQEGYVDLEEDPLTVGQPLEDGMVMPDYSDIQQEEDSVMFAGGGFLGMNNNVGLAQQNGKFNQYQKPNNTLGNMSMIGGIAGSIGGAMSGNQVGEAQDNQMIDGVKDTVAQATGPFGQMFRGIQKMGQGVGNMIGGEGGAAVSGLFSPEEATIANFKDNDLNFGQKLLGTVPGVGGVMAYKSKKKKEDRQIASNAAIANNQFRDQSQFEDGGLLRQPATSINMNPMGNTFSNGFQPLSVIPTFDKNRPRANTTSYINPIPSGVQTSQSFSQANITGRPVEYQQPKSSIFSRGLDSVKNSNVNADSMMRLAPVLNNLNQLNTQRKPTRKAPLLDTTLAKRRYMDNTSLTRGIDNTNNNTISAINQMGGSTGARRAAILGSNLQRMRGLSEANMQTQAMNRQVDDRADMLDAQVRAENLRRSEIANENFDKDLGAYDTNKSALMNTMANSIGNIGLENRNDRTVSKIFGYDSRGNYIEGGDSVDSTSSDKVSEDTSKQTSKENKFKVEDYLQLKDLPLFNKKEEVKKEEIKPEVKDVKPKTVKKSSKSNTVKKPEVIKKPETSPKPKKEKKVDVMNNNYGLNAWKNLLINTK